MDKEASYRYIIDKFGEDKIILRSEWLYSLLEDYIKSENLQERVGISKDILKHVIVDYFVDIDRLKSFAGIPKVNDSKIYSYTSFWVLRHKPLQVLKLQEQSGLAFVNEDFVSHMLRGYLFSKPENVPILNNKQEEVDLFVSTLVYYFKYREFSAQSIEMLLLAFVAGRGYQYSVDHQN